MDELIKIIKKEKKNEWVSGIIPGLLLHMCLSIVYCWSLVKVNIDNYILGNTSWAFSLMVFSLALTAIISVPYVERKTKDAARYGAVLFSLGLVGSGLSCQLDSLIGLYVFFGGCLGIGGGLIYQVPLKMLSKWFRGPHKGFMGKIFMILSAASSFIMVPTIKELVEDKGIVPMFTIMGIVCLSLLMLGAYLMEDPEEVYIPSRKKHHAILKWKYGFKNFFTLPGFVTLWLLLFINLSCGLAVISCERDMMLVCGFSVIMGMGLSRMISPVGKGFSRPLLNSFKEGNVYKAWWVIYGINLFAIFISLMSRELIWVGVLLINFGYGASFTIQPTLLVDLYGKKALSKTYSMLLTAWAAAGLIGNQIGEEIYNNGEGVWILLIFLGIAYIIGMLLALVFKGIYKLES